MISNTIQAAVAAALCGLSSPGASPVLPGSFEPAPVLTLASTQDVSQSGGHGITDFPDLPGCPQGQGYDEDCLLESQFWLLQVRILANAQHQANIQAIEAWFNNAMSQATSQAERLLLIAKRALKIIEENARHDAELAEEHAIYLASAQTCCGPNGEPGGSLGFDGLLEFPEIECEKPATLDEECAAELMKEFEAVAIDRIWDAVYDMQSATPDQELVIMQDLITFLETLKLDTINTIETDCCGEKGGDK